MTSNSALISIQFLSGIFDKDENVVARPVPSGSPHERDAPGAHAVAPVLDHRPVAGFVAVVVDALLAMAEAGEGVVLVVRAHPAGQDFAVGVPDIVAGEEAELVHVEALDRLGVFGRKGEVLQRPANALARLLPLAEAEDDQVAVRVPDGKRLWSEERAG